MNKVAFCILAGGKSSRFGFDKRIIKIKNKRLIDFPLFLLRNYTNNVYISSKNDDDITIDGIIIKDTILFGGPLCGMSEIFKNINTDYYLFLAADMPFVNAQIIDILLDNINQPYDVVLFKCENLWTPMPILMSRRVSEFFRNHSCKDKSIKDVIYKFRNKIIEWKKCVNFFNVNRDSDAKIANVILNGANREFTRFLVDEKLIKIHVNNKKLIQISMTPIYFNEFIYGYLCSHGYIKNKNSIIDIKYLGDDIFVELNNSFTNVVNLSISNFDINKETIKHSMKNLNDNLYLHNNIGGYHATGIFDENGDMIFMNEDVSKYSTIDKCVGYVLLNNLNIKKYFFVTTGRLTLLSIQKCINSGLNRIVSGSNITHDALNLAIKHGISVGRYVNRKNEEIIEVG